MKILDCTLRDGGYYNKWDFNQFELSETIKDLNNSGVDIVELGYKSPSDSGYYGIAKFCPEKLLEKYKFLDKVEYAFMLDVKEFLDSNGSLDKDVIYKTIAPKDSSIFSWCRLASYHKDIIQVDNFSQILKELGYKVTYNYMGVSLLDEDQLLSGLSVLKQSDVDIIYFADSFGNFNREEVKYYYDLFRSNSKALIGFHPHDNQGLAFSNAIYSIELGIDIIDATVMGMGRGAGNLRLEQLLLHLYRSMENINPFAVLDLVDKIYKPLHDKFKWGWDFSYMLSGIENIHPIYCQKLKANHKYTISQVSKILQNIPQKNRTSFNNTVLNESCGKVLSSTNTEGILIPELKDLLGRIEEDRDILICSRGDNLRENQETIREFVKNNNPLVLECNDTGLLHGIPRIKTFLNQVRFKEYLEQNLFEEEADIICGFSQYDEDLNSSLAEKIFGLSCSIDFEHFNLGVGKIIIPFFEAGIFSLAVSLLLKPKKILLAGFDGFEKKNDFVKNEMELFWEKFLPKIKKEFNIDIISILDTSYAIDVSSIYHLM